MGAVQITGGSSLLTVSHLLPTNSRGKLSVWPQHMNQKTGSLGNAVVDRVVLHIRPIQQKHDGGEQ